MQPRTPSDPISFIISLSNAKQDSHMKSVNKYTFIDWIEEINGHDCKMEVSYDIVFQGQLILFSD